MFVLLLIIIIPLIDQNCVEIAVIGNSSNGRLTNHNGRDSTLYGIDPNCKNGFTDQNITGNPLTKISVSLINSFSVPSNLPHQELFALGSFVGFEINIGVLYNIVNFDII